MMSRLCTRIVPELDFTVHDDTVLSLVEIVKCPIVLDVTDTMCIFNNNCYDRPNFDKYRCAAVRDNVAFGNSGYTDWQHENSIKDPRTNELLNYGQAIQNTYFEALVPRYALQRIIVARVSGLTASEADCFIPGDELQVGIVSFCDHIMKLQLARLPQIEAYQAVICMRQVTATETLAVQVTLPHSYVPPPFPDVLPPEPPPRESGTLVLNPNPLARRLVVMNDDDISISSDSSSVDSEISMGIRRIPYGSPSRRRIMHTSYSDNEEVVVVQPTQVTAITQPSQGDSDEISENIIAFTQPSFGYTAVTQPITGERENVTAVTQPSPDDNDEVTAVTQSSPGDSEEVALVVPVSVQPTINEEQPAPTSAQADIDEVEIDAILLSVVNEGIVNVAPVTNVTNVTNQPVPVVTNMSIQDQIRSTSNQRRLPNVPSFVLSKEGERLCHSILSLARGDGFGISLCYGKRAKWFADKLPTFFGAGGILAAYKPLTIGPVRKKISEAESVAKKLYNARSHESNGDASDEALPLFASIFFEYFDFSQTRETHQNTAREARKRNLRVNRSIIGQQAALSSSTVPALLTTVAPEGRERGTGEVAGEIIVSEMSVSGGTSSSASPSRRTAGNDGRSPRRRAYNVDFGISNSASLPPSTGGVRNMNVEGMQNRFADIASSIQDLTRHTFVRALNVINDDLIKAIGELNALESGGGSDRLMKAYTDQISDLEKEKLQASSIRDNMFCNSASTNTDEMAADTAMSVISDEDLHREVRRRESREVRRRER